MSLDKDIKLYAYKIPLYSFGLNIIIIGANIADTEGIKSFLEDVGFKFDGMVLMG